MNARLGDIALQIQLPADPLLTPEQLARITGRPQITRQMAWLADHGWHYELSDKGELLVGALYANLRLAGLVPGAVGAPGQDGGFDLNKTR